MAERRWARFAAILVILGLVATERLWGDVLPTKGPSQPPLRRAGVGRAVPASASIQQPPAPLPPPPPGRTDSRGQEDDDDALYDDEKPIRTLGIDTVPSRGELPPNHAAARFSREGRVRHRCGASRPWMVAVYNWEASAFCHRELHFEEPNLERLGHSIGLLQPVVSGAHFFARISALPYSMAAYPATECVYTLGHYRPGNYAPFQYLRLPLSLPGAAAQTGTVLGLVYLIP